MHLVLSLAEWCPRRSSCAIQIPIILYPSLLPTRNGCTSWRPDLKAALADGFYHTRPNYFSSDPADIELLILLKKALIIHEKIQQ
jgi:hypothetical protein